MESHLAQHELTANKPHLMTESGWGVANLQPASGFKVRRGSHGCMAASCQHAATQAGQVAAKIWSPALSTTDKVQPVLSVGHGQLV